MLGLKKLLRKFQKDHEFLMLVRGNYNTNPSAII